MSKEERRTMYPEFVRKSLIRMDAKTQAEVYQIGITAGYYSLEMVQEWENLPKTQVKVVENEVYKRELPILRSSTEAPTLSGTVLEGYAVVYG